MILECPWIRFRSKEKELPVDSRSSEAKKIAAAKKSKYSACWLHFGAGRQRNGEKEERGGEWER